MTREQAIVFGFIAGAFVAGWITRALTGAPARQEHGKGEPGEGGRERNPAVDPAEQLALIDRRFERVLEENRRGFDQALRAYHAMVAHLLGGRDRSGAATLEDEVSEALRSDAVNESMLDSIPASRNGALTDLELDLADWGFTYGVAWARAGERRPSEDADVIAREALRAAEAVFDAYTAGAEWTRRLEERPGPAADGGQTAAEDSLSRISSS